VVKKLSLKCSIYKNGMTIRFPKNFLFGSATSSHQIEGGNFNSDWYRFEHEPGRISDSSTSKITADSWHKWQEDIELLKHTHQNAYRFSVEWAKIEPKEGQFNARAIEHYRQILQELKRQKISSMVTLFHFSLPLWLADKGGFAKRQNVKYFVRFAEKMASELNDGVDLWVTLNEPNVYVASGYLQGKWCPGLRSPLLAFRVWKNLVLAHNLSYTALKARFTEASVGCVVNATAFEPYRNRILNKAVSRLAKLASSELFIRAIIKKSDFLGLNQYMKYSLSWRPPFKVPDATQTNDYGWHVHPEGLYRVVMENAKWRKPIYITENGIADAEDRLRPQFIEDNLRMLHEAITDGADVRGYFHWSLLDNFEWSSGYSMKFGLFTIDRQPRPSAFRYRDLIDKYSQNNHG